MQSSQFLLGCFCGAAITFIGCLALYFAIYLSSSSEIWKTIQNIEVDVRNERDTSKGTRESRWHSRRVQITMMAEGVSQPLLFGLTVSEKLVVVGFNIAIFNIWLIFLFLRRGVILLEICFAAAGQRFQWGTLTKVSRILSFLEEVLENIEMVTDVSVKASKMVVILCFQAVIKLLSEYKFKSAEDITKTVLQHSSTKLFDLQVLDTLSNLARLVGCETSPIFSDLRLGEFIHCFTALRKLHYTGGLEAKDVISLKPSAFRKVHRSLEIQKYIMFACAPYGQRALKFLGILPYGKHISNELAFCKLTGLSDPQSILSAQWDGRIYHPGYVLCVDHDQKEIILAVRGTFFPQDFLVDLACSAAAFTLGNHKGHCHEGMLRSAQNLLYSIEPILSGMLKREEFKGYKVTFTGHSLGAGIASLMLALLIASPEWLELAETNKFHCFGYGTPCILSPHISKSLELYITTVVMGNDMVPRFSLNSFQRIRDILKRMWKEPGRGDEILATLKSKTTEKQIESSEVSGNKISGSVTKDWIQEILSSLLLDDQSDHQPFLTAAGRVIWIDDRIPSSGNAEELNCKVVENVSLTFRDLVLTEDMFSAHLPQNYSSLLAKQQYFSHFSS